MKKMQTALIILKSGIHLITKAEQLEEEPSCHMQDPYMIKDDGTLEPWPRYTTDTDVLLYSETIATIVEPTNEIKKKYETVTK
tara:strand:- start:82 stop:330 length:249 start_codon:yes stop_codon:yes gene_type:complete